MRRASLALVGVLLSCPAPPASAAPVTPFKIVVSPGVPGKSIKKQILAQIFLRTAIKWGDGTPIKPVDLSLTSPLRSGFSRVVLGFTALDVQHYWSREISRGNIPPPVKQSDDEVIAFVAANPGAIGYVAEATPTPETVKLLELE